MQGRNIRCLPVIEHSPQDPFYNIADVDYIIKKYCTDVIYFVNSYHFWGMLALGDILRVQGNAAKINSQFTCISHWNYMDARKIFLENPSFFQIPVVNENGELEGDYIRYSETECSELIQFLELTFRNEKLKEWVKNNWGSILLVIPINSNMLPVYQMVLSYLRECAIPVDLISMRDIEEKMSDSDCFLFVDETECRMMQCVLRKPILMTKIVTYRKLVDLFQYDAHQSLIIDFLYKEISLKNDISILVIRYGDRESKYLNTYNKNKKDIFSKFDIYREYLSKGISKDFFCELYTDEYWQSILALNFQHQCINGVNRLKDCKGLYLNVIDGERKTFYQPAQYVSTVFCFGPCIIVGSLVEDKYTIESFLQQLLNMHDIRYIVRNCGAWKTLDDTMNRIVSTRFVKGDFLVIYIPEYNGTEFKTVTLADIMETNAVPFSWSTNTLEHCNHRINKIIAKYLFKIIHTKPKLLTNSCPVKIDVKKYIEKVYLMQYFSDFIASKYKSIGSIVMNCNPFTKGHRYLIEQAAHQVQFLIVFVVEEDRSFFSFYDRFRMVQAGVQDLEDVMVVPSGRYILSSTTFPEYFNKVLDKDIIRNAEYDIRIFAEGIAKPLGIIKRFFGEEPEDNITREYNDAMKHILPCYDILPVEISRLMYQDKYISAKKVRNYLSQGDNEMAFNMLPNSTKKYLQK